MTRSRNNWQWLLLYGCLSSAIVLSSNPAIAQVEANGLGTIVTPLGDTFNITGGTPAGNNLFHSLGLLNLLNPNQVANFTGLPPNIQNIFARISGGRSNINGQIQVTGGNQPNLFLMNPNGITFGASARLLVPGSFVATSARAIRFPGNAEFSFTSTAAELSNPLLQINPNALLFGPSPGAIVNRSLADLNVPNQSVTGLEVPVGKSLLLVGGDVRLEGGGLYAPGGRVELASVTGGAVGLAVQGNLLQLAVPPTARADISLTDFAKVDVRASARGDISVNARNLTIADGSFLATGIAANLGLTNSIAGDLQINATGTVTLTGLRDFINRSAIINAVGLKEAPGTGGNPGKIEIQADVLRMEGGAQIFAGTFGDQNGADVILQAREIYLTGEAEFGGGQVASSQVLTQAQETATGRGGNILIKQTSLLSVTDGGAINASTLGPGAAGNVDIVGVDRVVVDGRGQFRASRIIADTQSSGPAGILTVFSRELVVQNGGRVSAETTGSGDAGQLQVQATGFVIVDGRGSELNFNTRSQRRGAGNAGDLVIVTPRLSATNGARVSARTTGRGDAGTLVVIAPESVTIDGAGSGLFFDSTNAGLVQQFEAIKITTNQLRVQNQGQISVNATGSSGVGGDLQIAANSILMTHQGRITAVTESGQGGNMGLQVRDLLLMRFNSEISTSAEGPGDGGNIGIQAPNGFILAVLKENSDIVASAISGTGGRATATARRVDGFRQFVDRRTPESDFTASSDTGLDGLLDIITQDREILELPPIELVDPQIAQGCRAIRSRAEQDKFMVTGRGGLPPDPREPLNSDSVQVDLVTRQPESEGNSAPQTAIPPMQSTPPPLVEAQEWGVGEDGTIVLVAQPVNHSTVGIGQPIPDRCL